MTNPDFYVLVIAALLPLTASLVVFQENPYHALALRGILGAIAALTYTVLGAPDVALTEAMVGTLLAITLYAVAVRSSLVMRLGILEDALKSPKEKHSYQTGSLAEICGDFRRILKKRHMRLELVPFNDKQALQRALQEKEIHGTCVKTATSSPDVFPSEIEENQQPYYYTAIRIPRIYDILHTELAIPTTDIVYVNVKEGQTPEIEPPPQENIQEVQVETQPR